MSNSIADEDLRDFVWAKAELVGRDPAAHLLANPSPCMAGLCLLALALEGIFDESDQYRELMRRVVEATEGLSEYDRETLVCQAQRAIATARLVQTSPEPEGGFVAVF